MCRTGNVPALLQSFFNFTHVGKFGNAQPIYVNNWTKVVEGVPTPGKPTLNTVPDGQQCTGLVIGIELHFLYGLYGKVQRGQNGIVSAYVKYITGPWLYPNGA